MYIPPTDQTMESKAMNKIAVCARFPLLAAGLTLALVLSGGPVHARPDSQIMGQPGLPNLGQQDLPNLGQQITPLAPSGSRFMPLNPDLPDNPAWLAGQAVTTVVSPDQKTVVAYPSSASLAPHTDPYFRGFDNAFPDYYRYKEWEREFDARYARGGLPALSLVRFMHDHTGNFDTAMDGVNTPELQQADNDYAVGLLVEKIANSRYANNTLIFIIEDDAQDGGDHVDSHRTVAFVAGAYVKQGALVSSQYNTINFLRTIEEVLGLPPLNLNDALAKPMADLFNTTPSRWSFTAVPSAFLYNTQLPLPPREAGLIVPKPTHDAEYWAQATRGMDFSVEDRFDFAAYNRILWKGLMSDKPYPAAPTRMNLRQNRVERLASYRRSLQQQAAREPATGAN